MDSIFRPLRIYCDNSATVFFSNSSKMTNTNKHIDVKYVAINKRISGHQVSIDLLVLLV